MRMSTCSCYNQTFGSETKSLKPKEERIHSNAVAYRQRVYRDSKIYRTYGENHTCACTIVDPR